MIINLNTAGEKIKRARKLSGMSTKAFATELGVTTYRLKQWESGKQVPFFDMMMKIASVSGIAFDEFFD